MLKKQLFWLITVLLIILVGCSEDKKNAEDSPESSYNGNGKTKNPPETTEEAKHIYPFTGEETDGDVGQRMIGVMVNNHPEARPQTGLSSADIVFEILAEGRITRFLALFQSDLPEVVGPVRSAREYYFNLADGYGALYVYHGAADFVNDMIANQGIDHMNGSNYDNDGHLFKRESFRKAPHNSYLQMNAVKEVADGKGYEMTSDHEALPFLKEGEDVEGEPATAVDIVYSKRLHNQVSYKYDEDSGRYLRSSDGEPTVDLDTDEQVGVENLFIVETYHEVIDDAGRRKVDMKSGGNAYLLMKGKVQHVEWKNEDGRIIPVKDGKPVPFASGHTWINVIPTDPGIESSVTVSGGSE